MDIEELERLVQEEEERFKQWPSLKAHLIRKAARIQGIPTRELRHKMAVRLNEYRHEHTPQERKSEVERQIERIMAITERISKRGQW